jgi:hypothetical protein
MRYLVAAGLVAGTLVLASGAAEAGKGPKKPDRPFAIHVFTGSTEKDALDSTADVRKVIAEKKADWFTLTENRREADVVLEVTGREWTQKSENVIHGRMTAANLDGAHIIGQAIPGILDLHKGAWRGAAENMANRAEKFCRETYDDLVQAQKKREASAPAAAGH